MISEPVISGADHDLVLSDSIRARNPFPERRTKTDSSLLYSSVSRPSFGATLARSSGVIAAAVRTRQYDGNTICDHFS